jgi:putative Mg2+ transporter-C (MgtC) family protein
MPTHITWIDIAIRLALCTACAGLIGFDRDEHGRSAGLRTTILVSLAACVAMIQMNLLVQSNGKPPDSYVVMDIMRLPLGILSGIGFIGAGAILKRGDIVFGLTTAATLWYVTVMGLCFGGGQLGTGVAAFAIGIAVLWGLHKMEREMPREQSGTLRLSVAAGGPDESELEKLLRGEGFRIASVSVAMDLLAEGKNSYTWKLKWLGHGHVVNVPPGIQALAAKPKIERVEFHRQQ